MDKMFMNIFTGSVDTWENWKCESLAGNFPASDLETLCEVEKNEGVWEAVDK